MEEEKLLNVTTMAMSRYLEKTITIKIEIMHYTTKYLRVERNISVLLMKQDIYFYFGLLFRGRALDYHVEEGQILYLVGIPIDVVVVDHHSYQLTARQDDTPSILIPDSLATLYRQLNQLRREFAATYGNNDNNVQTSTSRSLEDQTAREEPQWAELANTTRQLLTGEIAELLSSVSTMLVDQVNVTDPSARELRQGRVVETGRLFSGLGSSLIALGRATSRIGMGHTQEDVSREVFMAPTWQISLQSQNPWLQTIIEAGRSIRPISFTISLENQQDFGVVIAEYENSNNTLTAEVKNDGILGIYIIMQYILELCWWYKRCWRCRRSLAIQIQNNIRW